MTRIGSQRHKKKNPFINIIEDCTVSRFHDISRNFVSLSPLNIPFLSLYFRGNAWLVFRNVTDSCRDPGWKNVE
jgi:hypothetical protein